MLKAIQKQDKKELKKHSSSVQIQNNITLLQRKTWNALLWNAYDELPTKDIHSISVQEIARLVGYDSKDQAYLKEVTLAMMHCIVEWDVLDKDGSAMWGAAVLLASVQIKHGVCSYGFAPHLRHELYNPDMFARLDLDMQKRFESKHALALWELCTDYLGAKRDYGETPWILLEDFRRLMGIGKDEYCAFRDINKRIITPALAEINRVSDFRVSVEYQRQGRKVTALKFKIRRVARLPEADTKQATLFPELEDMPLVVKELQEAGMSSQDAWDIWQQGFRFVDEAASSAEPREDADTAFVQYVREKIHLLKRRQTSGKVENSTGFLREALRHNYANPEYTQEQTRQAVAHEREAKQERARQAQALAQHKAELEHARDQALQALYLQLAQEAPEVLDQAVPLLLKDNYLFRQFYQRDQSALANYQARAMLQMGFNPSLAQHAPAQVAALEQHYAAQLAAVEAQLAALA
jgi:replication initiator protein